MQNEIFGISLSEEGRRQIIPLYKKIRLVFIGAIIWSALNLLSFVVQLTALKNVLLNSRSTSQLIIVYTLWILSILLFPLQGYYYYAFSKKIKLSVEEQDSYKFNGSFRLLNVNATLVLLSIVLNFLSMLNNFLYPFLS